ncbi:hypothetical protein CNR22_21015 [Sphingobacteriaceae bacterium]|nr:hypothetical protein CNR22_21015 [Sphingobacteriaceae bacterium]
MKKNLAIILVCFAFSCKKKTTQNIANHPVPSVPVTYITYPNDPLNFKIQSIGGWMYVENYGVNGIIIYRKSQEEFVAIERTSASLPNNPAARVVVQKDNFTLRDTISGSEWRIFDGSITKGPAEWALRLYGTSYNGNSLSVKN